MTIKSELLALQQADTDHVLHAADVVQWARENSDSQLHAAIEWDDARAANAHRLHQVRQLIQMHVVQADMTPMLVSLSIDRSKGGGYRSVSDVVEVPDLREIMLADALADLERVRLKYERVLELSRVWEEAARVKAEADSRPRRGRPRRATVDA